MSPDASIPPPSPEFLIGSILERDLDLLLLEEFAAGSDFWRWFVRTAIPEAAPAILLRVARSVHQPTGESDLELTFSLAGGTASGRLLIENKIDAGFQKEQRARYRARAQEHVACGDVACCWTVLVAPKDYTGANRKSDFDGHIPYEAIREWFTTNTDLGHRRFIKIAILDAAIARAKYGYDPVADAPVTDFWNAYWKFASDRAPHLEMREPGPKPGQSTWVRFFPEGLSDRVRLRHKMVRGFVDLEFAGAAPREARLRSALAPVLEPGMQVVRASGSVAIRIAVPRLDLKRPFAGQVEAAMAALQTAERLSAWLVASGARIDAALQ